MRVAVLVAGTNEPSNSNVLADAFIEGMKTVPGTSFEKLRLRELTIGHFTLDHYKPHHPVTDDFRRIQTLVEDAHGILIATPIWNFSVPAHLKNTLDHMGTFSLDAETRSRGMLNAKPFALVFTGGSGSLGWSLLRITTQHVVEAIKYFGGAVVLRHFEPSCMPGRGKFGLVVDKRPRTLAAMRRKGARFALIVDVYSRTGKLPWLIRFRYWFFKTFYAVGNRIMHPMRRRHRRH